MARLSDPITPSLRDGRLFGHIPGNKLPGYYHSIPPGQRPRGRGVQFQIGAVLQHSNTPSLRVAEIEDDDEDENEAQLLNITSASSPNCAKLQDSHNVFSEYLRENADSMDQFRELGVRLYD